MRYRISYDDSADKFAVRFITEVAENGLAREIVRLQASGRVIFQVVRIDA